MISDFFPIIKVGDKLGASYKTDQAWIDSVDKKATSTLEKLEIELNGHKANLIKESIRVRPLIFNYP